MGSARHGDGKSGPGTGRSPALPPAPHRRGIRRPSNLRLRRPPRRRERPRRSRLEMHPSPRRLRLQRPNLRTRRARPTPSQAPSAKADPVTPILPRYRPRATSRARVVRSGSASHRTRRARPTLPGGRDDPLQRAGGGEQRVQVQVQRLHERGAPALVRPPGEGDGGPERDHVPRPAPHPRYLRRDPGHERAAGELGRAALRLRQRQGQIGRQDQHLEADRRRDLAREQQPELRERGLPRVHAAASTSGSQRELDGRRVPQHPTVRLGQYGAGQYNAAIIGLAVRRRRDAERAVQGHRAPSRSSRSTGSWGALNKVAPSAPGPSSTITTPERSAKPSGFVHHAHLGFSIDRRSAVSCSVYTTSRTSPQDERDQIDDPKTPFINEGQRPDSQHDACSAPTFA